VIQILGASKDCLKFPFHRVALDKEQFRQDMPRALGRMAAAWGSPVLQLSALLGGFETSFGPKAQTPEPCMPGLATHP
jgi:hypothetical protein